MTKKRKNLVAVGCIALLAIVCFALSGIWQSDTPVSVEAPQSDTVEVDRAALPGSGETTPTPTTTPSAALEPTTTPSPASTEDGTEENPQDVDNESRDRADGTPSATAPPAPIMPSTPALAPTTPVAPDPAPVAPTLTPAPEPTPQVAPVPQPVEQPKPNGYAYCSCGAVLSEAELVAHMKQHALNGESHHYDTY